MDKRITMLGTLNRFREHALLRREGVEKAATAVINQAH